jgi:aspartyl-tRNA(Asn)/glutamyl-tRNA(Gln) amidotransferase subunit A
MSYADIASDAGGSIRNPCAMTGVVGLKPSFGRVPDYPPSPIGSMAVVGPICRTVRDVALVLNVIARADSRDPAANPFDGEDFLAGIEGGIADLRLAVSPTLGYARVDPEILAVFERAASALAAQSVERVETLFPDPAPLVGTFLAVGLARVYRGLGAARAPDERMDPAFVAAVRRGEQVGLQEYLDAVAARKL